MTRAQNVLAVILTPKAEESSKVLYCETRNNWTLRCAQNDGDAECDWVLQPYWLQDDEDEKKEDQPFGWSSLLRVPGLEPGAFWFVAKRSIQLGYIRVLFCCLLSLTGPNIE